MVSAVLLPAEGVITRERTMVSAVLLPAVRRVGRRRRGRGRGRGRGGGRLAAGGRRDACMGLGLG